MATETFANLRTGSTSVVWNNVNLGYTSEDGCSITIERSLLDVSVDAHGNSIVEQFKNGENATVTVTLMETSNENIADVWTNVFPYNGTGTGVDRLDLNYADNINSSMRNAANKLVLTPRNAEGQAGDETFIFWKAVAVEVGEIVLNNDQVRTLTVTFRAYPDTTNGLFTYGDSTT